MVIKQFCSFRANFLNSRSWKGGWMVGKLNSLCLTYQCGDYCVLIIAHRRVWNRFQAGQYAFLGKKKHLKSRSPTRHVISHSLCSIFWSLSCAERELLSHQHLRPRSQLWTGSKTHSKANVDDEIFIKSVFKLEGWEWILQFIYLFFCRFAPADILTGSVGERGERLMLSMLPRRSGHCQSCSHSFKSHK